MTNSLKTALFTLVLLSPFIFLSCQKEIEVDIPDYERKIVIEGSIENGSPAMVLVSKSVRYFSTLHTRCDSHCGIIGWGNGAAELGVL